MEKSLCKDCKNRIKSTHGLGDMEPVKVKYLGNDQVFELHSMGDQCNVFKCHMMNVTDCGAYTKTK